LGLVGEIRLRQVDAPAARFFLAVAPATSGKVLFDSQDSRAMQGDTLRLMRRAASTDLPGFDLPSLNRGRRIGVSSPSRW